MKLYVVRHGEVDINVKKQLNGRNNSILTDTGIIQAKNASIEIKNKKIDLIICSPLKRTKQTCELINVSQIPIIYDNRILERDTNSMMYKIKANVDLNIFYNPKYELIFNDCEGFGSILERIKKFIEDIRVKYADRNILVITHNDVCKAINCYLNNIYNIDEIIKYNQNNCEIIEYEI